MNTNLLLIKKLEEIETRQTKIINELLQMKLELLLTLKKIKDKKNDN